MQISGTAKRAVLCDRRVGVQSVAAIVSWDEVVALVAAGVARLARRRLARSSARAGRAPMRHRERAGGR